MIRLFLLGRLTPSPQGVRPPWSPCFRHRHWAGSWQLRGSAHPLAPPRVLEGPRGRVLALPCSLALPLPALANEVHTVGFNRILFALLPPSHTVVQTIARGVFEVIVDQSPLEPEETVEEQKIKVDDSNLFEEETSENEVTWTKTFSKKKTGKKTSLNSLSLCR